MNIKIDPLIIKNFPEVKIGVLIGKNVNNSKHFSEITNLLRQTEEELRTKYTIENIATVPKIVDWREAYRSFGCKPSEYRSSIEALARRVLQSKPLPTINPLVDLYNIVSMKYMLPAGGGNLDTIFGDIVLTFAQGTEEFTMLGQDKPTTVKHGEVIYRDEQKVLCRAWNYRESDQTKITENINDVYLLLEGLQHTSHEEMVNALCELNKLVSQYCGGTFKVFVLDKNNPEEFLS